MCRFSPTTAASSTNMYFVQTIQWSSKSPRASLRIAVLTSSQLYLLRSFPFFGLWQARALSDIMVWSIGELALDSEFRQPVSGISGRHDKSVRYPEHKSACSSVNITFHRRPKGARPVSGGRCSEHDITHVSAAFAVRPQICYGRRVTWRSCSCSSPCWVPRYTYRR